MDFRKVLARIFFLENVADLLKIDQTKSSTDIEAQFMAEELDQRKAELGDGLLSSSQTNLKIVGGTVKQTDVQTLKKLIFRGTRGRALVNTFDLNLDISDILNNKSFTFDAMEGYVIIFDDSMNLSQSIMRICTSFQSDLYETSIGSISADLANAKE